MMFPIAIAPVVFPARPFGRADFIRLARLASRKELLAALQARFPGAEFAPSCGLLYGRDHLAQFAGFVVPGARGRGRRASYRSVLAPDEARALLSR